MVFPILNKFHPHSQYKLLYADLPHVRDTLPPQIKSIQSFLPETFALHAKMKVYPCSKTAIMHITHSFTDNPSYMPPTYLSTKFNMFRCRQINNVSSNCGFRYHRPPNLCLHLHLKNASRIIRTNHLSEASQAFHQPSFHALNRK